MPQVQSPPRCLQTPWSQSQQWEGGLHSSTPCSCGRRACLPDKAKCDRHTSRQAHTAQRSSACRKQAIWHTESLAPQRRARRRLWRAAPRWGGRPPTAQLGRMRRASRGRQACQAPWQGPQRALRNRPAGRRRVRLPNPILTSGDGGPRGHRNTSASASRGAWCSATCSRRRPRASTRAPYLPARARLSAARTCAGPRAQLQRATLARGATCLSCGRVWSSECLLRLDARRAPLTAAPGHRTAVPGGGVQHAWRTRTAAPASPWAGASPVTGLGAPPVRTAKRAGPPPARARALLGDT